MNNKSEKEGLARLIVQSEIRPWPMEAFGQFLKTADHLTLNEFPLYVEFPLRCAFRKSAEELMMGKNAAEARIERAASIALTDLGEFKLSRDFETGTENEVRVWGSRSAVQMMLELPLPPSWRKIGTIHSHPWGKGGRLPYLISEKFKPFKFSGRDVAMHLSMTRLTYPANFVVTPAGMGILVSSIFTKTSLVVDSHLLNLSNEECSKIEGDPTPFLQEHQIAYYSCRYDEEMLTRQI